MVVHLLNYCPSRDIAVFLQHEVVFDVLTSADIHKRLSRKLNPRKWKEDIQPFIPVLDMGTCGAVQHECLEIFLMVLRLHPIQISDWIRIIAMCSSEHKHEILDYLIKTTLYVGTIDYVMKSLANHRTAPDAYPYWFHERKFEASMKLAQTRKQELMHTESSTSPSLKMRRLNE
jgi:hypothetical protein